MRIRRPSEAVLDAPWAYAPGRQLPELLVAEGEGLRAVAPGEIEAGDELLGDRAACAFRQYRKWCVDLHSGCEIRTGLAVATPPRGRSPAPGRRGAPPCPRPPHQRAPPRRRSPERPRPRALRPWPRARV